MPVTVKKPVIQKRIEKLRKPPIKQALNIVAQGKRADAASHRWNRFKAGIETKEETPHSGIVFVNDNVTGSVSRGGFNNISTATNKQIGGFLHFGTPDHGPKTATMLSWLSGGQRVFAKKVEGIKATNWWGLTETIKTKVREMLTKYYGR